MPRNKTSSEDRSQTLYDLHNYGVNLDSRDIYIHSSYGNSADDGEAGVDYRQATTFIKNLNFLNKLDEKPILGHLHSIGGCWDNGMAMFNSIEFSKSPVTLLGYSQTSSMSGIIFQAAPVRVMMPDCHFLMHYGESWTGGHPFANKTAADFDMIACKRMLHIFSEKAIKTGKYFKDKKTKSLTTVYNFFNRTLKDKVDWYLSAEEAVYYGLADGILGDRKYKSLEALKEIK